MRARVLFFLAALLMLAAPARAAVPDSIEAEAAENYFYIEPGYSGSSIVLFGSIDREKLRAKDFDIAVTIRGPSRPVTVWKKGRHAGLWINSERVTFEGVPNYYSVLSTRPAAEMAPLAERKAYGIGLDALALPLKSSGGTPGEAAPQEFQDALIRLKRSSGLFTEAEQGRCRVSWHAAVPLARQSAGRGRPRPLSGSASISFRTARLLARPTPASG